MKISSRSERLTADEDRSANMIGSACVKPDFKEERRIERLNFLASLFLLSSSVKIGYSLGVLFSVHSGRLLSRVNIRTRWL
jgi:hypothetical protein